MTLKKKNIPQLIVFLTINILIIWGAELGLNQVTILIGDFSTRDYGVLGKLVVLPAVFGLVIGMISWSLPKSFKEVLVFWHVGPHRLPSREAFTRIASTDQRIDLDRLRQRIGDFPTSAEKQSSLWYAIYRKHGNEPSVNDANGAYLLYREMTGLTLVLITAAVACEFAIPKSLLESVLLLGALGVEMTVVVFAARSAANRLVANVLAIEASSSTQAASAASKPRKTKPKADRSDTNN